MARMTAEQKLAAMAAKEAEKKAKRAAEDAAAKAVMAKIKKDVKEQKAAERAGKAAKLGELVLDILGDIDVDTLRNKLASLASASAPVAQVSNPAYSAPSYSG